MFVVDVNLWHRSPTFGPMLLVQDRGVAELLSYFFLYHTDFFFTWRWGRFDSISRMHHSTILLLVLCSAVRGHHTVVLVPFLAGVVWQEMYISPLFIARGGAGESPPAVAQKVAMEGAGGGMEDEGRGLVVHGYERNPEVGEIVDGPPHCSCSCLAVNGR